MLKYRMSALNEYETCPYKCMETYGKIGEEPNQSEGNFYSHVGTILHECFEHYGREQIEGRFCSIGDLMQILNAKMVDFPYPYPSGNLKPFEWNELMREQLVWTYENHLLNTQFHDVEHKFDDLKLLDTTDLCFSGTIDVIRKNDRGYVLEDYKTGRVYTKKEIQSNMQSCIYALACKEMFGELPYKFRFIFTKFKKVIEIDITPEQINRALNRINLNIERIEKGLFEPNTSNQYFCKNFCNSETCPSKKKKKKEEEYTDVSTGWGGVK